jgi:hypothetical protein
MMMAMVIMIVKVMMTMMRMRAVEESVVPAAQPR